MLAAAAFRTMGAHMHISQALPSTCCSGMGTQHNRDDIVGTKNSNPGVLHSATYYVVVCSAASHVAAGMSKKGVYEWCEAARLVMSFTASVTRMKCLHCCSQTASDVVGML